MILTNFVSNAESNKNPSSERKVKKTRKKVRYKITKKKFHKVRSNPVVLLISILLKTK